MQERPDQQTGAEPFSIEIIDDYRPIAGTRPLRRLALMTLAPFMLGWLPPIAVMAYLTAVGTFIAIGNFLLAQAWGLPTHEIVIEARALCHDLYGAGARFMLTLGLALGLLGLILHAQNIASVREKYRRYRVKTTFLLTNAAISISAIGGARMDVPWHAVAKTAVLGDYMIIRLSRYMVFLIPLQALTQAQRCLLQNHIESLLAGARIEGPLP